MNTLLDNIYCSTDPEVKSLTNRLPLLLQTIATSNVVNHVQKFTTTTTITDYHCLSENDFSNIVYNVVQEEKRVEIQKDDDCVMDHRFFIYLD